MAINNVVLVGRLTKDVELRATPSGANVCNFTLAVDDYNGKENVAYFVECVAWNKQAEFLSNYCKKGHLVGVTGKITTRTYDRKDGTKAYVTEVLCNQVQSFQPKSDEQNAVKEKEVEEEQDTLDFLQDELPF
jgi:single-strand DNA-binding protein